LDKGNLHFKEGLFGEVKRISILERKTIKGVIDEALGSYLEGKKFSTLEK